MHVELGIDPEVHVGVADLSACVRRAVDALPHGQRRAVLLFYLSGLSYKETANLLGIEVGAVRTRLHKARKEFWKLVKDQREADEGIR